MEFINSIKKIILKYCQDSDSSNNNRNLLRNLIILGLLGTIFLFAGNLFNGTGQQTVSPPEENISREAQETEETDYVKLRPGNYQKIFLL